MNFDEIPIRVRYGETDQMGVVHHGNYALYMEMGRTEWLRKKGISYKQMEDDGVMLPVISMSLKFKKSAHYDEVIKVKTSLTKLPSVKIEFDYEIYNESDELLVAANTVLAFIDMKSKRPIKCPDYIFEKLKV
ncbi:acyl-CoA thioesterase [Hanstruepera flava]|uniref:acyl-CoA thioesterase n=1 Tax=Hanstruepera flava TaxID=2930218 RepID=UPI002027B718|nr:thioesterase family protein [Hanstruepera flava]